MQLDLRKQQILMAIISDYIVTAEPVGSRTIARKYKLGVSPATIRNEMADLEEMGYIEQPHTSAGRIPSEQGYRYYVDYLMEKRGLTPEEEEFIQREYRTKVYDVGQLIQRTGQILSQLTHHASLVQAPKIKASFIKHLHLVEMAPGLAMLLVIMDNGLVYHRLVEVPATICPGDLETISAVLNAKLQGCSMESIRLTLIREVYLELARYKYILSVIFEILEKSFTLKSEDKIYLGGVFNILSQPEFRNIEKVKTLLSLLEQESLLNNFVTEKANQEGVSVHIGGEISCWEMQDCSIVISAYHIKGRPIGSIGVLGPTRMDYSKVISVVEYLTKNLSFLLENMFKG